MKKLFSLVVAVAAMLNVSAKTETKIEVKAGGHVLVAYHRTGDENSGWKSHRGEKHGGDDAAAGERQGKP